MFLIFIPPVTFGGVYFLWWKMMDLNHRGTIISRASLPLDESSIWCLRRDSNPYEFLYPADFKSAVYSYSTTQAKNMAAALRIELRLAESKSAVLTVIRYRYIMARAQGFEPRLTVLETVVLPLDDTRVWQRRWDSNPWCFLWHGCFQDSYLKPLGHPSIIW